MMDLKNIFQIKNSSMVLISRSRNTVLTKPLFYYHVPKSAGLTFRASIMWGQHYKFGITNDPGLAGLKGQIFDWDKPHNVIQLLHNYCSIVAWKPYGFHELFNQEFNLVTVVREPFERLVSRHRYHCNLRAEKPSQGSFEKFFRAEPQLNHQSKLLAGAHDHAESSFELYDRAVENLDNFLAFAPIGKVNEMLENLIGLYELPNVFGQRINVAPEWTRFDWEPYREEVLELNQIDKALFEYVSENYRICAPAENELYELSGPENDINPLSVLVRDADKNRKFDFQGVLTDEIIRDFTSQGSKKEKIEKWLGEIEP